MTLKEMASEVARREGKKSSARVGDVREILSILSDLVFEMPLGEIENALRKNGERRAKRKARAK